MMTRIKNDPEHMDSFKQGCGGGRRKQSKPIRVFLEDGEEAPPGHQQLSKAPAGSTDASSNNDGLIEDLPRAESEMDVDDAMQQCDLCSDTFSSQTALMEHVQTQHSINDENAHDSFPTKYHQLGMELSSRTEVSADDSTDKVHHTPNNIEQNSDSQGLPCNGSKARVFHKDAYCELCDREFCNKYFLKTHRANKHGIFEDDTPPPSVESMHMPHMQAVSAATSSAEFVRAMAAASAIASKASSAAAFPVANKIPKLNAPIEIIPELQKFQDQHMQNMSHHSSLLSRPSLPATPPKITSSLSTPTKPMGLSKPSMGSDRPGKPTPDMEDYCELCQKHFCNKYYLKKHKQDVHGIMPEPSPSNTGKRGRPPMSGQMGGFPGLGNTPMSLPSSSNLMTPSSSTMSNGSANIPGLGNVMLINPFAPPMLLQAPQVLGGLPQGFPQLGALPPTPQSATTPTSESPKSSSSSAGAVISSANVPINNESMRSMGVLNAEAYCELCRKEFCNKYFLRIHKANKHGIFIDEGLSPPGQSGMPVPNTPSLPNPGDLPPGTINITPTMEPESQSKPEEGKMERSPLSSSHGSSDRELEKGEIRRHDNLDEVCHLCKKEFANKYSLKVHMINAHGITIPDFDLLPAKDHKMRMESQSQAASMAQQGGNMFGNMIAAKLADRVMCDICNKEVCNKYFLKTHKVKVHGMDPAVVEREINASMRDRESPSKHGTSPGSSILASMARSMENGPKSHTPPSSEGSTAAGEVPRPKDEDLLKMGIDPEAYCEICKKEFCSKYFLKTHKQNIHGIKSYDNGLQIPTSGSGSFPFLSSEASDMPYFFPSLVSNNNNKMISSGNTSPVSQTDSEKMKSLANERVKCELCNKEICNKYFLRTHMLNKHGINMDFGPLAPPFMPGMHGLPFGLPLDKAAMDMPLGFLNQALMARMHEEMAQPLDLKKPVLSPESSVHSEKKVSENGYKESSGGLMGSMAPSAWHVPPSSHGHKKEPHNDLKLGLEKCDICSLMFAEKLMLQMHMIQNHPGQVMVSTKSKTTADDKINSINKALSLRRKYQKSRRIGGIIRKGNALLPATNGVHKKKFRCAHCKVRFSSKLECQSHIHRTHSKSRKSTKRNTKENVAVSRAAPMPNGMDNNCELVMQPFNLEGHGQFAPAVIYLPVYQRVNKPIAVTFNLKPKPTEQ